MFESISENFVGIRFNAVSCVSVSLVRDNTFEVADEVFLLCLRDQNRFRSTKQKGT